MELHTLTNIFLWLTILNGGLLLIWSAILMLAPGFVYEMHAKLFPMSREAFNIITYSFLGFYKILVICFCLFPWLALTIIG